MTNAEVFWLIIAQICSAASVIVAICAYKLSAKNRRDEIRLETIKLVQDYLDNIITQIAIIRGFYNASGINDIIGNIETESMKKFDLSELKNNVKEGQLEKIKEIKSSEEYLLNAVTVANEGDCSAINWNEIVRKTEEAFSLMKTDIRENNTEKAKYIKNFSRKQINNVISDVINRLNILASYLIHDIADDELAFNLLHKSYIGAIRTLYYDICNSNDFNSHEPIILLFLRWAKK